MGIPDSECKQLGDIYILSQTRLIILAIRTGRHSLGAFTGRSPLPPRWIRIPQTWPNDAFHAYLEASTPNNLHSQS